MDLPVLADELVGLAEGARRNGTGTDRCSEGEGEDSGEKSRVVHDGGWKSVG